MTRPTRSSTSSRYGRRRSYSSANSSSAIGSPHTDRRSVTDATCGEMNVPVVRPCAQASAVVSRAMVVLPFVPVTWIDGIRQLGMVEQVARAAAMRSRSGSGMCSGLPGRPGPRALRRGPRRSPRAQPRPSSCSRERRRLGGRPPRPAPRSLATDVRRGLLHERRVARASARAFSPSASRGGQLAADALPRGLRVERPPASSRTSDASTGRRTSPRRSVAAGRRLDARTGWPGGWISGRTPRPAARAGPARSPAASAGPCGMS